ncbi:MAG: HAD family hydrolase [Deltaproteobacteria bacterium]|jgi:HAD superfamily hydrolase (TIGR01509 family)|nr:HAD family hydrolase [Deltaproteobacteria bacterium]
MSFGFAVFDFDMTLIDSIKPLTISANLLAKEFGLAEVKYEQVYDAEVSVKNCTFELLWSALWGRCDPAWYPAYLDHMTEAEYRAMELFPGARETLEELVRRGARLGLASNRDYPAKALQALGVDGLFEAVVGQFDVANVKPAPDMILKTLALLGARPQDALYVCDSRGDLLAAAAAGVKTFAMSTGGHPVEELLSLGAWKAGDQLADILPCFV